MDTGFFQNFPKNIKESLKLAALKELV